VDNIGDFVHPKLVLEARGILRNFEWGRGEVKVFIRASIEKYNT